MTGLALLAAVSEILQLFVDGRRAGIADWAIDVGGIAVGVAIAESLRRRNRRELVRD